MRDRKPTAGFWITVALVVVLVGYPLSWGPACGLMTRTGIGRRRLIPAVYRPITMIAESGSTANNAIRWYAKLFAPRGWGLYSLPVMDGAPGEKKWEMRWYDRET